MAGANDESRERWHSLAIPVRGREGIECGGNPAIFVRDACQPKPHLNSAQGSGEHEIVEASQVTDAKNFAGDFGKTRAEGHVEIFENYFSKVVGVVAFGHPYGS